MPIEVEEEKFGMSRDKLYEKLKQWNVFGRRYFYPLICDYLCYRDLPLKDPLTVARRVADRILTLPIYDSLEISDVETICDIIRDLHSMGRKGESGINFLLLSIEKISSFTAELFLPVGIPPALEPFTSKGKRKTG